MHIFKFLPYPLVLIGEPSRIRTCDPLIKSQMHAFPATYRIVLKSTHFQYLTQNSRPRASLNIPLHPNLDATFLQPFFPRSHCPHRSRNHIQIHMEERYADTATRSTANRYNHPKCKNEIRKSRALQGAVGARLPLDGPASSEKRRQNPLSAG